MKFREQALIFFQRGREDLAAAEAMLPFPVVTDAIVGFHCQQAVEKMLKAVLSDARIPFRRTHNIRALMDLLAASDIVLPTELAGVDRFTPFAVEHRYDPILPQDAPFDRAQSVALVRELRRWVESRVKP